MTLNSFDDNALKQLLDEKSELFWSELIGRTISCESFHDAYALATLRKRALKQGLSPSNEGRVTLRLAMLGAYTLQPLLVLVEQILFSYGIDAEIFLGEFENHVSEILDQSSDLYRFHPDVIMLMPSTMRYRYSGKLSDSEASVESELRHNVEELLGLCQTAHTNCSAEIVLSNFMLPCYFDPGPVRHRTLASEWSSLKWLNLRLGALAPENVHILDLEFLSARFGGLKARDERAWFESKQPFSTDFCFQVAREIGHIIRMLKSPPHKVLVVDLDDTLWGGVIGDDGLMGIELGDTSARGACFRQFQSIIQNLSKRGVILAACSKNDLAVAIEPFEKHPEMVLKMQDFAIFMANWNPKSENLLAIAEKLNLGLDSFVFIDDNPAEIELVRQLLPQVKTILLGSDPSMFFQQLLDSRFFDVRSISQEDVDRTRQYQVETDRRELFKEVGNLEDYLRSLEMVARITPFQPLDVPRISQLINKSNTFNLTTKRRTEAQVQDLINSDTINFAVRLKDRFGDLGLVSVMIAVQTSESTVEIDSWLMSCRVLTRQLEYALMNSLVAAARRRGCAKISGLYLPTAKNAMVKDLYPAMGFTAIITLPDRLVFELDCNEFEDFKTSIEIVNS